MRKKFFYRAASAATTFALVATALMPAAAIAEVIPVANPALDDACGLDIMLVLDRSGSIDSTEMTQLKDAAKLFVDAFLPSTPTLMGVVSFSTTAALDQTLTGDATAVKTAIDAITPTSLTNWEAAILAAKTELEGVNDRADAANPDLMVVFSDGDPTTSDGPLSDLDDAVTAANAAKMSAASMPIRIVGVGIGDSVTVANFEAITNGASSIVSPPDAVSKDTDIILSDFADLATALGDLADMLCTPDEKDHCCNGGDDTVENDNEALVVNTVVSGAYTGTNTAGGSTGGAGGRGGNIRNTGGEDSKQDVKDSHTGSGGNGGNAGLGGEVASGNALATADLNSVVNDNSADINRCACPGNNCKGGATIVRNRNGGEVGNVAASDADTGLNSALGVQGGAGGRGGNIKNTEGNQKVKESSTGNGGSGGSTTGEEQPGGGGFIGTGNTASHSSVTNVVNRNVTGVRR